MKNNNTAEIAATRRTFDGVTVHFHVDGTVSTISTYLYGRLPVANMWTIIENACTYTFDEVCAALRARKIPARRVPVPPNAEEIMAQNARRRFDTAVLRNTYRRAITWR
jgi:hypothetical protein